MIRLDYLKIKKEFMKNKIKFIFTFCINVIFLLFIIALAFSLEERLARLALAGFLFILLWLMKIQDLIVAQSINDAAVENTRFLLLAEHLKMDCVNDIRDGISSTHESWAVIHKYSWMTPFMSWCYLIIAFLLIISSF